MLASIRLLVLVLWPTVLVWLLPGQHRDGDGVVLVWLLVVLYSVGATLVLVAGPRADRVLPVCLPLFAVAAATGAMAGPQREMALLVPLFLGVLCVIAAMRLSPRATWVQVAVSCASALVCVAWVADDLVQVVASFVAVVAGIAAPAMAILGLRTQLVAAHAREHRLASTDPLTGVLNRRGLFEAAADLLGSGRDVDVVTLDLDEFKLLNDTYGHAVGDEALRAVADGLRALHDGTAGAGRPLVARLGGEEFLVLTVAGEGPVEELAEAVRRAAAVSLVGGVRTSASVGAVRRLPPAAPEERTAWLLRQVDVADELMYRAKRSGGDRVLAEPGRAAAAAGPPPAPAAAPSG